MITRKQLIQYIRTLDWGPVQNEFPVVAYLIRCADDYGYVEEIAQGKVKAENDELMNQVNTWANEAAQEIIGLVPVVGDVLEIVFKAVGFDFGALEAQNKSQLAVNRLNEFVQYIEQNYSKGIQQIEDMHDFNLKVITNIHRLQSARPKCTALTEGCAKEHNQFGFRTHLLKNAIQGLYDIYYTYCINDTVFNQWAQSFRNYSSTSGVTTQAGLGGLGLVALAGLLFIKKG